jgi:hypothetical protein
MAILHITTSLLMGRTQTELWALTSTTASAFGGRTSHRKTTKSSQRSLSRAGDVGTIVVPALLSISSTTGLLEVLLNHTINNHVGGSLLTNSANSSLYESANIQQTKVPTHSVALQIVLARYLSRMAVFSLSLAAALDLARNHSVILLKANAAILGVIICSLEESLGGFEDLGVGR